MTGVVTLCSPRPIHHRQGPRAGLRQNLFDDPLPGGVTFCLKPDPVQSSPPPHGARTWRQDGETKAHGERPSPAANMLGLHPRQCHADFAPAERPASCCPTSPRWQVRASWAERTGQRASARGADDMTGDMTRRDVCSKGCFDRMMVGEVFTAAKLFTMRDDDSA